MPVSQVPLTPSQIRAGRALLDWSQEELAKKAGVSLSTVRDYEKERRGGSVGGLKSIRDALESANVLFLKSDGDLGPGVRLRAIAPNVLRWPTKAGLFGELTIPVEWKGRDYVVFVSQDILDDIGRLSGGQTEDTYLRLFERYRGQILSAAASAIDERGSTPDGRVYLTVGDFPPGFV